MMNKNYLLAVLVILSVLAVKAFSGYSGIDIMADSTVYSVTTGHYQVACKSTACYVLDTETGLGRWVK